MWVHDKIFGLVALLTFQDTNAGTLWPDTEERSWVIELRHAFSQVESEIAEDGPSLRAVM